MVVWFRQRGFVLVGRIDDAVQKAKLVGGVQYLSCVPHSVLIAYEKREDPARPLRVMIWITPDDASAP